MARAIITQQTIFFLLVLFVLAIFFYNVVHFSTGLLATKYEEKLRVQGEDIKKLKERLITCQSDPPPCAGPAHSMGESSESTQPLPPPPPSSITTSTTPQSSSPVIPILVMACNREDYLKTTLTALFKYKPAHFPVIVSQGCGHTGVSQLLKNEYMNSVVALQHHKKPDILAYFAIAQHYGWALNQVFSVMNYDSVIIVEDDLEISSDFFDYFIALYPILRSDSSLYCVSSWNDNGMVEVVRDATAVYRTEVFPGLGWMMLKSLWNEVKGKWPEKYWDEFMREPQIRNGRSCLFPEISRNRNIGQRGTSERQFWDKISRIKFNEEYVNFTNMDMSYLLKERYDADLKQRISNAKEVSWTEVQNYENMELRINYDSIRNFKSLAQYFQLMDDEKEGMPRTSYKGIVSFWNKTNKIFLVPEDIDSKW